MAQLCSTFSITASCPEELIIVKEEMLLLIDTIVDDAFGLKVKPTPIHSLMTYSLLVVDGYICFYYSILTYPILLHHIVIAGKRD